MPISQSAIGDTLAIAALLLAAFFVYVFYQKKHVYLLAWALAWLVLLLVEARPLYPASWFSSRTAGSLQEWLLFIAALGFLRGARLYTHAPLRTRWLLAAAAVAGFWTLFLRMGWFDIPLRLAVLFTFAFAARELFKEGRKQQSRADALLALCFAAWGILLFLQPFRMHIALVGEIDLRFAILLAQLFAAVLMVVVTYEEERRGLEGNILALSNLNLAASTFAGGEIQRMLGYALDRVLSLTRLPAGLLCLHYGDSKGPKVIASSGVTQGFCAAMQAADLDEYTLRLVARLGGLVVLRDLSRESSWEALDREASFHQVRQLLLAQGVHTAVGISLQSKEQVFGVMLLGTPHKRHLTPPELRLLLALGQQIGLAVENSYLIQQTARRSEEMHTLNEIGRALSATLQAEAIFDKIWDEVSRLFEGAEFYIALYDSTRREIDLVLEIRNGERQPKRRLPTGNHLIEYIIRSGQPLLIRERFEQEAAQLRVRPREGAGSYCGVPLLLNEQAIGALCLFDSKEGAFDEGQLELLRVLANEASIALQNARLFEEQERKSRQLALVNTVSRQAISTMNPEELLANITVALEEGLPYDHIGIALLDEAQQELVVRAEAGTRRGAIDRRRELGDGLAGRAALSGELETLESDESPGNQTMLADSLSAVALPINYAQRLLGVLYVEAAIPWEFSQDELRLLGTTADLLAIGLHNAFTLQKAQEQAITDGLTGAKTHRYLMEALTAEWKRSARASRPFSIVMLDLDHFKFVNDTHGHLAGDVVLQVVARILEQNCRRSDVVSRYGGDEFVILMPETAFDQARQISTKLRAWIGGDRTLREKNVTASFGIASFPLQASNPQQLIQLADAAMYASKHKGGNAVSSLQDLPGHEPVPEHPEASESNVDIAPSSVTLGPVAFAMVRQEIGQISRSISPAVVENTVFQVSAVLREKLTSLIMNLEAMDPLLRGHSQRVAAYVLPVAISLGLDATETNEVYTAALLHDIGMLGISEDVWRKPDSLTPEEHRIIKTHVSLGCALLSGAYGLEGVIKIIHSHHEFTDGSGYPEGLRGEQIPLGSRLIAVCEAYDAMTTTYPYAPARDPEWASAELERCAGNQFDAQIVRAFLDSVHRDLLADASFRLQVAASEKTNLTAR
jgi:diguanylate cyclase (GGDEF)-like protein